MRWVTPWKKLWAMLHIWRAKQMAGIKWFSNRFSSTLFFSEMLWSLVWSTPALVWPLVCWSFPFWATWPTSKTRRWSKWPRTDPDWSFWPTQSLFSLYQHLSFGPSYSSPCCWWVMNMSIFRLFYCTLWWWVLKIPEFFDWGFFLQKSEFWVILSAWLWSFSSIMLENGGVLCWSFILEFLNSLEFFVYTEASLFTYSLLLLGNQAIAHFRCWGLTRSSAALSHLSPAWWTTGRRRCCRTGERASINDVHTLCEGGWPKKNT